MKRTHAITTFTTCLGALIQCVFGASTAPAQTKGLPRSAAEQKAVSEKSADVHPFRPAEFTDARGQKWSVIKANGVTLFGVPVASGHYTRQQRVKVISDRLGRCYNKISLSQRGNYAVQKVNRETAVCIRNPGRAGGMPASMLVVTIDANFEKKLGRRREDIAFYWRDLMAYNMKKAHIKDFKFGPQKDMLGRPLDPDKTWMNIPDGYAKQSH